MSQEPKEYVKVKMLREHWEAVRDHCNLDSGDFIVTDVIIKDDLFKGDSRHKELKKLADKAYEALHKYEFEKRNAKL